MTTAEDLAQISATINALTIERDGIDAEIMALNIQYVQCYLELYGMGVASALESLAAELETCVAILEDAKAKG